MFTNKSITTHFDIHQLTSEQVEPVMNRLKQKYPGSSIHKINDYGRVPPSIRISFDCPVDDAAWNELIKAVEKVIS